MNKQRHFKRTEETNGWVSVYLVDEKGIMVNTEPVCTVPVDYHLWFAEWLEKQSPFEVPE